MKTGAGTFQGDPKFIFFTISLMAYKIFDFNMYYFVKLIVVEGRDEAAWRAEEGLGA